MVVAVEEYELAAGLAREFALYYMPRGDERKVAAGVAGRRVESAVEEPLPL
jgi:hypothetical protein